jgi:Domain of unknown function (DUF4845)
MSLNPFNGRQRRVRCAVSDRRRQGGMTFIGAMFVLGMVGLIGYAGLRLVPLYLNYMKVSRSLEAAAGEFKSDSVDLGAIRRSLEKHWQIEDISGVDSKEVEILKDDGVVSLHVVYDDTAPFIAPVSLTMHFDKSVKVQ